MKRNDWKKKNKKPAEMLGRVVVLSETSGLIQIILPSDVTFSAWLTKAGHWPGSLSKELLERGICPPGILCLGSSNSWAERGASHVFPSTCHGL